MKQHKKHVFLLPLFSRRISTGFYMVRWIDRACMRVTSIDRPQSLHARDFLVEPVLETTYVVMTEG